MNDRKKGFLTKTAVFFAGLIFSFFLLELALNGWVKAFSLLNDHNNREALSRKNVRRILCAGDSMTALGGSRSYPAQLEEILNSKAGSGRVYVINTAMIGATSDHIVSSLPRDMDLYKPDMLIVMTGINDYGIRYFDGIDKGSSGILNGGKISVLFRLIARELRRVKGSRQTLPARFDGSRARMLKLLGFRYLTKGDPVRSAGCFKKAIIFRPEDDQNYIGLGLAYYRMKKYVEYEYAFKEAMRLNPADSWGYAAMNWQYKADERYFLPEDQYVRTIAGCKDCPWAYAALACINWEKGDFARAESYFKRALQIEPGNIPASVDYAMFLKSVSRIPEAEAVLNGCLELNPANIWPYMALGVLYKETGRFKEQENVLIKALEIEPENMELMAEEAYCLKSQGRFQDAEKYFIKSADLFPGCAWPYYGLSICYRLSGRPDKEKEVLELCLIKDPDMRMAQGALGSLYIKRGEYQSALELFNNAYISDPTNERALGGLASVYRLMGRHDEAKKAEDEFLRADETCYNPITRRNYRKIAEISRSRGVQLVCAQYPCRSIKPLRKMLGVSGASVLFVDNERIFKDAIASAGHEKYFIDMFLGDFGHCTPEGNALLAGNIARSISGFIFDGDERGD